MEAFFLTGPTEAASEESWSGTATIKWGEDFCLSLGKPVAHGGDFRLSNTRTFLATKGIAEMGSGALNKLRALPEYKPGRQGAKGHAYKTEVPIVVGQRYAIVGADGRTYGKIRVIDYDARLLYPAETITFEWAYMPDGGRFYP